MVTARRVLALFSISLGVCLSTTIIEGPKDAFALVHSNAAFNCTVSLPWNIIIWMIEGKPILTIVIGGPIITNPQFENQNYTTRSTFTSELIISRVTMQNNMTVQCNIQTEEIRQAFLFVQVDGQLSFATEISSIEQNRVFNIVCKAEGWNPAPAILWKKNNTNIDSKMYSTTVQQSSENRYNTFSTLNLTLSVSSKITCLANIKALPQPRTTALFITVKPTADRNQSWLIIAIVVPIAVAILLIILIIVIVICLRRRKPYETRYQNELRKRSSKTPQEMSTNGKEIYGVDNTGMSIGSENDYRFSPSLTSPYWIDMRSREMNRNVLETPPAPADNYGVQERTQSQPMNVPGNPRKIRHMTTV
ncbi:immunoglobulin superfamily member 5 [Amblyraja radiata]|uniref:immunoglobulin superfamily member 5 n=1 Tax=Amblyraja radiata TaxID=386614 RepID=UPI0014034AC0|nr:immunoglobulin superfamily member 5 [Amblyraja radiata]